MTTQSTDETVHIIQTGECVESIAFGYGLTPDIIWDYDKNADLRKTRDQRDVLLAGDKVFIPKPRPKKESVSTEKSTLFVAQRALRNVRLRLVRAPQSAPPPPQMLQPNEYDNPPPAPAKAEAWADVDVQITGKDFTWNGKTDTDGKLNADVPMSATTAMMVVAAETEDERQFELQFGRLDPIDTPSGVAQRLSNMGYRTQTSKEITPQLASALKAFQYAKGIPTTGEADDKTREALKG